MSGVRVWSNRSELDPEYSASPYVADAQDRGEPTHVVYPREEADAIEHLIEAAAHMCKHPQNPRSLADLNVTTRHLYALRSTERGAS